MHSPILDRSLEALASVRKHVSFSAKLRSHVGAPELKSKDEDAECLDLRRLLEDATDATSWRVIDHCAAVTRTYALFENFVMEILREYLAFLAGAYKLTDLGGDFNIRYTRGIGKILQDHRKHRYRELNMATVIAGAREALAGEQGYQIQAEALIRAEQNLRMDELQRLFADCGLTGTEAWIATHPAVKEFFAEEARLSETAGSELRQIVEYRNEAAHGDVDNVLGSDVLIEFTHFFEALCRSLVDFVQYDTLRRAKELGRAAVIGVISERFREDIVVAKVNNATLAVGDQLYVYRKGMTMIATLQSIRLDDVDVETADITNETEVGLRLGVRAKVGCELLRLTEAAVKAPDASVAD